MKIKIKSKDSELEAEGTADELKKVIEQFLQPAPVTITATPTVTLTAPACNYWWHTYEVEGGCYKCKHCGYIYLITNPGNIPYYITFLA